MDIGQLLLDHIVDIAAVIIFLISMLIGAKQGFTKTLVGFTCNLLAFTGAKLLAAPAAEYVYTNHFKDSMIAQLESIFNGAGNSAADALGSVLSVLPGNAGEYAREAGLVSGESISQALQDNLISAAQIESSIVQPVMLQLLRIALFAVFGLILTIILRIIGVMIVHAVKKSDMLKTPDTVLGIVLGGLKGLLYVFLFGSAVIMLSYVSSSIAEYTVGSYVCDAVSTVINI